MKYLLFFLLVVLLIDFMGFTAWVISGQLPKDNVYIGAISNAIIQLVN